MHTLTKLFSISLFLLPVQLLCNDPQPKITSRQLFGHQLLFIENTAFASTDLFIAEVVLSDSTHSSDTIYLDTISLSMCDQWELNTNVSCGVWELHSDTLIFWFHSFTSFDNEASALDPPEERTWKKTYVIRKNLEIVLLSTNYGQTESGMVNRNLNEEILRKTKSAFREARGLCY